jgi:hypothetical protein
MLKEEVEDMEEIACPAAAVMVVTGETVPLEEVVMVAMEETANKVPVGMVGMEATVLEEGEKEVLVALDPEETDRTETMETLDNQD